MALDIATIAQVAKLASELPIPIKPWRDEDGHEYYLVTCAAESPGSLWAEAHPELLRRIEIPGGGSMLLLPDPANEPSLWEALGGDSALRGATP